MGILILFLCSPGCTMNRFPASVIECVHPRNEDIICYRYSWFNFDTLIFIFGNTQSAVVGYNVG